MNGNDLQEQIGKTEDGVSNLQMELQQDLIESRS